MWPARGPLTLQQSRITEHGDLPKHLLLLRPALRAPQKPTAPIELTAAAAQHAAPLRHSLALPILPCGLPIPAALQYVFRLLPGQVPLKVGQATCGHRPAQPGLVRAGCAACSSKRDAPGCPGFCSPPSAPPHPPPTPGYGRPRRSSHTALWGGCAAPCTAATEAAGGVLQAGAC